MNNNTWKLNTLLNNLAATLRTDGLGLKLDPEETKSKIHEDMVSSTRNLLTYMALLPVAPFIVKKLDSTSRCGVTQARVV
uniref:Uncharacterized protein n=1 Tax=Prolemur simus TaxID=1328070 RepID=A0A8C8ZSX9_PROSS